MINIKPNKGKKLIAKAGEKEYLRLPIKTHFIKPCDKIDNIVLKYVLSSAEKGDIVVLCQKIVSIVLHKVVYKSYVQVGFWAKFLSRFAKKTPAGFSVGNPYKMQVAIDLAGLPRIFLACFLGGAAKLFGIRGVFYRVAGNEINQIDGFYGKAFKEYENMGILGLKNCDKLCNKLTEKYSLSFVVADVNDLGRNVLGKSLGVDKKLILKLLKDNPAGQSNEQTPIIIIRENV